MLQSKGTSFEGVENLKAWTDEMDKYLIYKINAEEEYVFKTSKSKLDLASKMNSIDHYLSEEFCSFDGKADRVKFFQFLSARVYHPLLKRQLSLPTLECKHEDPVTLSYFGISSTTVSKRQIKHFYDLI